MPVPATMGRSKDALDVIQVERVLHIPPHSHHLRVATDGVLGEHRAVVWLVGVAMKSATGHSHCTHSLQGTLNANSVSWRSTGGLFLGWIFPTQWLILIIRISQRHTNDSTVLFCCDFPCHSLMPWPLQIFRFLTTGLTWKISFWHFFDCLSFRWSNEIPDLSFHYKPVYFCASCRHLKARGGTSIHAINFWATKKKL